jgi:hypothetical protein
MTEAELEAALADAVRREHAARQVGAERLQQFAMDEIRALRELLRRSSAEATHGDGNAQAAVL